MNDIGAALALVFAIVVVCCVVSQVVKALAGIA